VEIMELFALFCRFQLVCR